MKRWLMHHWSQMDSFSKSLCGLQNHFLIIWMMIKHRSSSDHGNQFLLLPPSSPQILTLRHFTVITITLFPDSLTYITKLLRGQLELQNLVLWVVQSEMLGHQLAHKKNVRSWKTTAVSLTTGICMILYSFTTGIWIQFNHWIEYSYKMASGWSHFFHLFSFMLQKCGMLPLKQKASKFK